MAIQKTIVAAPYYVPLSYHDVQIYSVYKVAGVVVVNISSYFNADAAATEGVQPLMKSAIQIVGAPDENVEAWVNDQLVLAESEEIPVVGIMDQSKYPWASGYTPQNRFFFAGGTVVALPETTE